MKRMIVLAVLVAFLLSGCEIYKSIEPLAVPASALVIQNSIKKNPEDINTYYKLLSRLKLLYATLDNNLTLSDFQKLTKEVGIKSDWAIVGSALYSIYKDKIEINSNSVDKSKKALNEVITILSDALYIIHPK